MLIILEGVDGSGKTTLAALLSRALNAKVIHATRETPNTFTWFYETIVEARDRNIIADRFFWGQFVYQGVGERKLSWEGLSDLERELHLSGGAMVYVTAPDDVIMTRLNSRGEQLSLPLDTLKARYEFMLRRADIPVIQYNTHTGEVK